MLSSVMLIGCILACAIAIGGCTISVIGFISGNSKKLKKSSDDLINEAHRLLEANKLMHDYEKDVFGWWGGDKKKADTMTASEIRKKWAEHQKRLRDLGVEGEVKSSFTREAHSDQNETKI